MKYQKDNIIKNKETTNVCLYTLVLLLLRTQAASDTRDHLSDTSITLPVGSVLLSDSHFLSEPSAGGGGSSGV